MSKLSKNKKNEKRQVFESRLTDYDIHLFREGTHYRLFDKLGSHVQGSDHDKGVYFAVWAPEADYVSVICDYNSWNSGANTMIPRNDSSGIWETFIPGLQVGALYKYHLRNRHTGQTFEKADPFAKMSETPPLTASVVYSSSPVWRDKHWMQTRGENKAISIYEVHLGSWLKAADNKKNFLSYREITPLLIEHVQKMGFTHVELMPVTEHPFYGSWGYQTLGYFAPTSRYGSPDDFAWMVGQFHQSNIGVILDWVPSHFPEDLHGLYRFDGSALYEHEDPRRGFHPDWKSAIFNYGRNEVRSFLISSAFFWLEHFHIDALRVDAVASMLYLDYSRPPGEWLPNQHGGNENLEAIAFIQQLNKAIYAHFPDVHTIAEESTAWPGVTKPVHLGGLGFGMKWMMGWMHDTLTYFSKDSIFRKYHQNQLTFSINYAFTENFCLPLSHDEVVHGKQSLLEKMPGDDWQKFANLRLLYTYMFTHPGIKLLFMGDEFGQRKEWNHDTELDWHLTTMPGHGGLMKCVADLNSLYVKLPELHELNFSYGGFEFIDIKDNENSVISYLRKSSNEKDHLLIVLNLTPVPREMYATGIPANVPYEVIFSSDQIYYGGSGYPYPAIYTNRSEPIHGKNSSLLLTLPPLAGIILKPLKKLP